MQGKGILEFPNGDKYEGYFNENLFEGKGKMFIKSGGSFKGLFK